MKDQSTEAKKIRIKIKKCAYEVQRGYYSGIEAEHFINREIDEYIESLEDWSIEERHDEVTKLYRTKWRLLIQATSGKHPIRIPKPEQWIVFYLGDKELASYSLRGTFDGELQSTKELLAYENNCKPEDISQKLEWR